jgi:transglutaminase-like putative cysteine protease
MYQNYEDGVIMDNTVLIKDEKKAGVPFSTRIFQFLVIAIGGWGGISMLVESIGIPCDIVRINGVVLIYSAVVFGLCLIPSYELVKTFFGILSYALFFYSRLGEILNGFYVAENLVLRRIAEYYGTETLTFKADYTTAREDTTLLVIMVFLPIITLLAVAVIRNFMVGISGLIMLFPVSACFLLGLIPSEPYLISYMACILYLSRSGYHLGHSAQRQQRSLLHRVSSRAAAWLCMISIAVFFLMKVFVTREEYDGITRIQEVKSEIQTAMRDFSLEDLGRQLSEVKLFYRKVTSTGLSGGELGKTGQVQYLNTKHLTVVAPTESINEGIYLKGYVGSVYTGDKWEKHSDKTQQAYKRLLERLPREQFFPADQMGIFLKHFQSEKEIQADAENSGWYDYSLNRGSMEVDYQGANKKFMYAPYFTDYSIMDDILYEQDLYAAPASRKAHYEYEYYYNISLLNTPSFFENLFGKLSDFTPYEKLYRDYVYQVYTMLPEEGLKNIKRDFSPDRVEKKAKSITEKIEFIKQYLDENTQYSLTPGKLPEGEDFAEYFLYVNKVGYCAHYASAATLMLRTMGIPARYVEGYAFGRDAVYKSAGIQETARYTNHGRTSVKTAQSEVNVMDYNAHAWVEVYFDNCGWVPVEFTPGSAVNYNDSVVADMEEFSDNMEDGNIKKALEENTSPTPELSVPKSDLPAEINREELSEPVKEASTETGGLIYLWIVLLAVLLAAITGLLYRIRRTSKARYSRNHSKRAIFLFGEIEKIIRVCRGLPGKKALLEESETYVREHFEYMEAEDLERLMEIVRRARFGRGRISGQELSRVLDCRNELYRRVNREMSLTGRIYLKIVLLL